MEGEPRRDGGGKGKKKKCPKQESAQQDKEVPCGSQEDTSKAAGETAGELSAEGWGAERVQGGSSLRTKSGSWRIRPSEAPRGSELESDPSLHQAAELVT